MDVGCNSSVRKSLLGTCFKSSHIPLPLELGDDSEMTFLILQVPESQPRQDLGALQELRHGSGAARVSSLASCAASGAHSA